MPFVPDTFSSAEKIKDPDLAEECIGTALEIFYYDAAECAITYAAEALLCMTPFAVTEKK